MPELKDGRCMLLHTLRAKCTTTSSHVQERYVTKKKSGTRFGRTIHQEIVPYKRSSSASEKRLKMILRTRVTSSLSGVEAICYEKREQVVALPHRLRYIHYAAGDDSSNEMEAGDTARCISRRRSNRILATPKEAQPRSGT